MFMFLSREVYETVATLVFLEVIKVPWIKVSSEVHNAMKQYLLDIEGMSLGDLVGNAFAFAIENLGDFEEFAEIGETEEEEEETKDEEEGD
jgi:hypothetical protein